MEVQPDIKTTSFHYGSIVDLELKINRYEKCLARIHSDYLSVVQGRFYDATSIRHSSGSTPLSRIACENYPSHDQAISHNTNDQGGGLLRPPPWRFETEGRRA